MQCFKMFKEIFATGLLLAKFYLFNFGFVIRFDFSRAKISGKTLLFRNNSLNPAN